MEKPDYIILKNKCPKCGYQVVSYQESPLHEKSKEVWFIACDDHKCDYAYPDQYATLQDLAKKFEAED